MWPRYWRLISFNQLNCNFGSVATGPPISWFSFEISSCSVPREFYL